MYSRQEAAKLKETFWTTFGRYMQPVLPADGERVNWVNYKTGIQGIAFKMDADTQHAGISIVLSHPDATMRQQHYTQLQQLKTLLHNELNEVWTWQQDVQDAYGKTYSRIGTTASGINIMKQEDWPALISFFKPRIIALDAFWSHVKYAFEV
ncbi:MAG: DUF4268 domain-containing protein [Flavipsychrobacter sp.]|nr:DUF4268 domain-containing protein [Flavipsychrobacter sp.]